MSNRRNADNQKRTNQKLTAKRQRPLRFLIPLIFIVSLLGATLLIQFFTKTGFFYTPGVLTLDATLTDAEKSTLNSVFADQKLDHNLFITAYTTTEKPELQENEFLVDILVPVTDFYSAKTSISEDDLAPLLSRLETAPESSEISSGDVSLISIDDLDNSQKLLSIGEKYYLDEFDSGAVFRVLKFASDAFKTEVLPRVSDLELLNKTFPESSTVLTFAQTGVTALSRGMYTKLNSVGDATYFSEKISDFLSSFDLTHTSNESSFTNYATSRNICSDWDFVDTLLDIGLDIVELTGNHNQDCGDDAALATINKYAELGIETVGGGKTAAEAAEPLEISQKGTDISFFAYNLSTGGATYDNTPGANQYYEESAASEIAAAKAKGNFVIVDVQYYECNDYDHTSEYTACDYADSAAGDQVGLFRHLIDLGADLVVGTSAHQTQTFELYGDGVIYYGLGNLFFDQVWWPGTTRSLILGHYFYNGKLLQTKLTGTVYGENMQTTLLDDSTMEWWINRLVSARPTPAVKVDTSKNQALETALEETASKSIDFTTTDEELAKIVENWRSEAGGTSSVLIYDLDNEKTLVASNSTKTYNTASLYKLFVVYEGYRRLQNGTWLASDSAGQTGKTRLECLDLAIRESNSACAETFWSEIGHSELDSIIKTDFKITNSNISGLASTPEDILKIMRLFYLHPNLDSSDLIATMKDSFLNQPVTTYDWRRGLPAGFSTAVNVYNKVGWDWGGSTWNIYHDAAILEFPEENRHFAVIVMTNKIANAKISELGTTLESYLSKS